MKTEGASAVKTRAGRRYDHEGQGLARPLELDSVRIRFTQGFPKGNA